MRRAIVRNLGAAGSVVVLLMLLGCLGLYFPIEFVFYLLFGWIFFLIRTLPPVQTDWGQIAVFAIAFVGCCGLVHLLMKSFRSTDPNGPAGARTSDNDVLHISDEPPLPWTWKKSLVGVVGICLLFVAGLAAVGVVLQTLWMTESRLIDNGLSFEAARRSQNKSTQRQIAIGVHDFSDGFGRLPSGAPFKPGKPLKSWMLQIEPFFEGGGYVPSADPGLPWNHPQNERDYSRQFDRFKSPYVDDDVKSLYKPDYGRTDYASNGLVIGPGKAWTIEAIANGDGSSNTIMIGDAQSNQKPWAHPCNWRKAELGLQHPDGFYTANPHGNFSFTMCDTSARAIHADIDPKIFHRLATPDGGEVVNINDL